MAIAIHRKEMEPLQFKTNFDSIWYSKCELDAVLKTRFSFIQVQYINPYFIWDTHNNISTSSSKSVSVKITGKIVPMNAMQAYGGSEGISSRILNLGIRWK